eukprot:TRINITY_DN67513_c0_g1_i2.p1 TRINITY_DN67513_c0_g1~~TRINITY_DN67513_c0_g1_i2.p1  ORF type:complete len:367 (+),score=44.11 TRINITY_DN67513_c0_g1_i2:126-1226(+)
MSLLRYSLRLPIMQAPMAGPPATSEFVIAACNAGVIGSLGAAYFTPEKLSTSIQTIKSQTVHTKVPFAINLFIPRGRTTAANPPKGQYTAYLERLSNFYTQHHLPPLKLPDGELELLQSQDKERENFENNIQVILAQQPPIFSWTFGIPEPYILKQLKQRDIITIGTATTVKEACLLQQAGVDAVVAQGYEAGGHRGAFLKSAKHSLVGTMSLVPQVADALKGSGVSVLAAGGIADARGVRAAQVLGADMVVMGTTFLAATESPLAQPYKDSLVATDAEDTSFTTAFSGRVARGVKNQFMEEMEQLEVPEWPLPNELTRSLRSHMAQEGIVACQSVWSGQSALLARQQPIATIVDNIQRELASFAG